MSNTRRRSSQGPQFIQYFNSLLKALQDLGGSGRRTEVVNKVISSQRYVTDEENEQLSDGSTRIVKNINWARFYLTKAGYIDGSKRGVWVLTEQGSQTEFLSAEEALELFHFVQQEFKTSDRPLSKETETISHFDTESVEKADLLEKFEHREMALRQLLELRSDGFERFCQRLLRESGFEQVTVTGRSGDGGIDGHGTLMINSFVSFRVAFQCKRYSGSVGASIVRDFRGSIMGRADKGIVMTTGSYTPDARKEAMRDGATPIELIDGEKLIDLLEELELGLTKKRTITIYEVDAKFFDEFRAT